MTIKINIAENNKCISCGKKLTWVKKFILDDKEPELKRVEELLICKKCIKIIEQNKKIKQKILDLEFELFSLELAKSKI